MTVELDDLVLSEALVATGDLDPQQDDDPKALSRGLQSLLARMLPRYG